MEMLQATGTDLHANWSKMPSDYTYLGADRDQLFNADYKHVDGDPCERCDGSKLKAHPLRNPHNPKVFYYTIASAD